MMEITLIAALIGSIFMLFGLFLLDFKWVVSGLIPVLLFLLGVLFLGWNI